MIIISTPIFSLIEDRLSFKTIRGNWLENLYRGGLARRQLIQFTERHQNGRQHKESRKRVQLNQCFPFVCRAYITDRIARIATISGSTKKIEPIEAIAIVQVSANRN